jgi:hypothetical protein
VGDEEKDEPEVRKEDVGNDLDDPDVRKEDVGKDLDNPDVRKEDVGMDLDELMLDCGDLLSIVLAWHTTDRPTTTTII